MRLNEIILRLVQLFFLIFIIGCTPKLLLKDNLLNNEIAICTQMSEYIPDTLKTMLDSVTSKFIGDYNSENHKYHLISCQNDSLRSLFIDVLRISITDPGKQARGVVWTTIGTITPFVMIVMGSPIYIWFAYLPRSTIQTKMHLTNDISEGNKGIPRQMVAVSSKYFGSYANQKALLLASYYKRLKDEMDKIEHKYKK